MRVLALTLLAGLLAVTAPPASALCAVDAEGGCGDAVVPHALRFEVREDCPGGAALCVVDVDGNFSAAPNSARYNVTVANKASAEVLFELFTIPRPDGEDAGRFAAERLAEVRIPAGQSAFIQDALVSQDATHVRAQAGDGTRHGELDAELLNFRILAMTPGDGEPVDHPAQDDAEDGDGQAPPADGKDAPFLPAVALLGLLALFAGFRRDD